MSDSDFKIKDSVLVSYTGRRKTIEIPEGVTVIQYNTFYYSKEISSITIPSSVLDINLYNSAFASNVSVKVDPNNKVYYSENDNIIERSTGKLIFCGKGYIPEGVEVLTTTPIYGRKFENLHLPSTFIKVDSYDGYMQLNVSNELIVHPDNKKFYSENNCIVEKSTGVLVRGTSKSAIPNTVKRIGVRAFISCETLSEVTIPNSVETIGQSAFEGCKNLTNVYISSSVKNIEKYAFYGCNDIRKLTLENSNTVLEKDAFGVFKNVELIVPNDFYQVSTSICDSFMFFLKPNTPKDYAMLWMNYNAKKWQEWFMKRKFDYNETLKEIGNHLLSLKKITSKVEKRFQEFIILYSSELSSELVNELTKKISGDDKGGLGAATTTATKIEAELQKIALDSFSEEMEYVKKTLKYKGVDCECSLTVLKTFFEEYLQIFKANSREYAGFTSTMYNLVPITSLVIPENAEKISSYFDKQAFSDYLEKMAYGTTYRYFCIPYARYATEESMQECVKEIKKRMKGNSKEQYWAENLMEAIYYSDTIAAFNYIEKNGDINRYANLRGMTVQEFRDSFSLPDFGFADNGCVTFAGEKGNIKVSVADNYKLILIEEKTGKELKTFPKKSVDAEKFTEFKKSLEEFYSLRRDYLKKIYITGEIISSNIWNSTYIKNSLFRPIIGSVIWQDSAGQLFEVVSGVCKDIYGNPYTPSGDIKVAHVLDMKKEQIIAWQNHLIKTQKSLVIEQVWEPIVQFDNIKEIISRYKGAEMSKKDRTDFKKILKVKEIDVNFEFSKGVYNYYAGKYEFDEKVKICIGKYLILHYIHDEASGIATLGDFEVLNSKKLKRRELNTILFELDRITLKYVIAKDIVDRLTDQLLSVFTVAQISEFIDFSTKSKSVNCTARLLDYKNTNFEESDAFDMFVL